MEGFRFSNPRAVGSSIRSAWRIQRSLLSGDHSPGECRLVRCLATVPPTSLYSRRFGSDSATGYSSPLLGSCSARTVPFASASPFSIQRFHFSTSNGGAEKPGGGSEVFAGTGTDIGGGGEWVDKLNDVWHGVTGVVNRTAERAKEVSDGMNPHVQNVLDSHPYLNTVVVPIGYTLTGTILAWVVMPKLLRRLQRFAVRSPGGVLSTSISGQEVPYEKSVWGALEDPLRYLVTFMTFSQICAMLAPTTVASQYLGQAWKGATTISLVWFLYRWKTNLISLALASHSLAVADRDKWLTLDRVSSVGLFVIGLTAFAEASGVAVQSILTVGGVGGVATAFAARDVLGNVLGGLSMGVSKPFSIGDTIQAGSIEGQVIEMGLTSTMLLNAEKFPVIVPNSLFSSQVIVNKSRAHFRAMVKVVPLVVDDVDKVAQISKDIEAMIKSNPKVFLGKEVPYCFLSKIGSSSAELTLGCNLKHMVTFLLYSLFHPTSFSLHVFLFHYGI
ncbi:unnamed protein product [Linum tenue]|uniref:Mechanosensitive ion channel MscS domain-containing protein n=1 Tax=Linum tenue TaxID=586396 RepID=A0AAV0LTE3_9ROSI|nr:unnamed protein product [Linum tenue]